MLRFSLGQPEALILAVADQITGKTPHPLRIADM